MKTIEKVAYGVIIAMSIATIAIGVLAINGWKELTDEVNADVSRIREEITLMDIEKYYGENAKETYISIDTEWTENGNGGIGTYEFEYWGETVRFNAVSADESCRTFTYVPMDVR